MGRKESNQTNKNLLNDIDYKFGNHDCSIQQICHIFLTLTLESNRLRHWAQGGLMSVVISVVYRPSVIRQEQILKMSSAANTW